MDVAPRLLLRADPCILKNGAQTHDFCLKRLTGKVFQRDTYLNLITMTDRSPRSGGLDNLSAAVEVSAARAQPPADLSTAWIVQTPNNDPEVCLVASTRGGSHRQSMLVAISPNLHAACSVLELSTHHRHGSHCAS